MSIKNSNLEISEMFSVYKYLILKASPAKLMSWFLQTSNVDHCTFLAYFFSTEITPNLMWYNVAHENCVRDKLQLEYELKNKPTGNLQDLTTLLSMLDMYIDLLSKAMDKQKSESNGNIKAGAVIAANTVAAAIATPFAVNAAVVGTSSLVGFQATGIAAGSYAASMMSAAAIANGGSIASGSAIAVLQSVGATGLAFGPVGWGVTAIAGATAAGLISYSRWNGRE